MKAIGSLRRFGGVLLFGVYVPISGLAAEATAKPAHPLNVLFIVCDDLNTHVGCYGDPIVKTPNIDRLAARGVRFEHAYAQYPVCNPYRTSFLSGLHPETTGVMDQQTSLKRKMKEVVFMNEHFKANGYFTAAIGKIEHGGHNDAQWDLRDEMRGAGGEEDEGEAPKKGARAQTAGAERTPRKRETSLPYLRERATADNDPELTDTFIARRVVKLLQEKRDQPFFIGVGFHKPHVPHVAPKKFFDMYPPEKMPLAFVPPGDEKDIPPAALQSQRNYQATMSEQRKRDIIAAYYACVSYVDDRIGQVFATMDRLKLWDNTIVVFIGDHGWNFGEHNWWAKASLFEESCRAPLIVAAPGVKGGRQCG